MAGWGSGWGGGFGGGGGGPPPPQIVQETVGLTEGLDVLLPLKVLGAQALSPFLVRVDFSHDLDYTTGSPTLEPSNYIITSPSLTVSDVALSPPKAVILQTSEQANSTHLLTVNAARSAPGDPIDLANNTALFAGFPLVPTFFATAQSRRKVQLTFSTEMLQNAAFTDTANYTLTSLQGVAITIDAVTLFGPNPGFRVVLDLGADLTPGGYFVVTIDTSAGIQAVNGFPFLTETDMFQWAEMLSVLSNPINISIGSFSGEVTTGLLGQPAGQVFFSPALEVAAANSSIQIDECVVCTKAFDVYEIPGIPDPNALMTFGGAIATTLNDTDSVLFATPERLGLASMTLTDSQADTWSGATDGPADAELVETIDITKAGFLNATPWALFPASASASNSTNAVVFDGVDEYVDMGNAAALSFTNASTFTLLGWFKSTDTDGALISKQDSAGTEQGYSVALTTGGKLRIELVNSTGSDEIIIETIGSFNDGFWHHVAVTYDGSSTAAGVTIYADGVAQTSTVVQDTLSATIANAIAFQLGTINAAASFFAGTLDDVAVYDIELSSAQVTTVYNGGTPPDLTSVGPTVDLVGYWLMGDGDTFATLTDNSANANDGTMTNMEAADIVVDSPPASVFITADNLAAIGAGPTTNINLQP